MGEPESVIEYEPVPPRPRAMQLDPVLDRAIGHLVLRVAALLALLLIAALIPTPLGVWHFGEKRQWIVAVDTFGLRAGRAGNPTDYGSVPVFAAKMMIVGVPAWLALRATSRGPMAKRRRAVRADQVMPACRCPET